MSKLKFVSDSFHQDADILLEEFSKKDSKHFSAFAEVWKERGFPFIFMGYDDDDKLKKFTEEIFHVASKFINPSTLIRQIGGIYLLYALYRHQTLNPPVRIRIVLDQMTTITKLSNFLSFEDHKSFHYVVSYLVKNSFDFVACARPMGPTMSVKLTEDWKRECKDNLFSMQVDLKKDMTDLAESKSLKEIGDLIAEYSAANKAIKAPSAVNDVARSLLEFTSRLESMLGSAVQTKKSISTSTFLSSSSIGSRRVDLKMKAFGVVACSKTGIATNLSDKDIIESDDDLPILRPKRRPLRRKRGPRKVGRPKKEIKDESDDSLDEPVMQKSSANKNNRRSRMTRYHYSQGEELQKISYYENLKFSSNNAGCQLFSDSEVDDPESSGNGLVEEKICNEANEY